MASCDSCGNESDTLMSITQNGLTHTFDSFECAVHVMAPTCRTCGCRILGHGTRDGGYLYCCDHCAPQSATGLRLVDDWPNELPSGFTEQWTDQSAQNNQAEQEARL